MWQRFSVCCSFARKSDGITCELHPRNQAGSAAAAIWYRTKVVELQTGVVTTRLQFTSWSERVDPDGYKAIHYPQGDSWKNCKTAALKVMLARDEENVFPGATHYYSPRAQAQLHAKNPTIYPNTPPFAVPDKRVENLEGC